LTLLTTTLVYSQSPKGTHSKEGPIVDVLKKAVASYNAGDWYTYQSIYADTARIHINTTDYISPEERVAQMTEQLEAIVRPPFGPGIVAELARFGEGLKDPGLFASSDIEGPYMPRGCDIPFSGS
jgi:hypothetical protein